MGYAYLLQFCDSNTMLHQLDEPEFDKLSEFELQSLARWRIPLRIWFSRADLYVFLLVFLSFHPMIAHSPFLWAAGDDPATIWSPPVYPPSPCGFQSFGLQIHQENQKSDREPIRWIQASQLGWAQNGGASDAPGMRTTFNGFQRISMDPKGARKAGDGIVCCRKPWKSFEFE